MVIGEEPGEILSISELPQIQNEEAMVPSSSWSTEAIKNLIMLCGEVEVDKLQKTKGPSKWGLIEKKMKERGFPKSSDQCRLRWFREKGNYRKFVDHNKKTGACRINYKFENEMYDALKDDLSVAPSVLGTATTLMDTSHTTSYVEPVGSAKSVKTRYKKRPFEDVIEEYEKRQDKLINTMKENHAEMVSAVHQVASNIEKQNHLIEILIEHLKK